MNSNNNRDIEYQEARAFMAKVNQAAVSASDEQKNTARRTQSAFAIRMSQNPLPGTCEGDPLARVIADWSYNAYLLALFDGVAPTDGNVIERCKRIHRENERFYRLRPRRPRRAAGGTA